MKLRIRTLSWLCVLTLLVAILASCAPTPTGPILNGVSIENYAIVYSENDVDYCQRAAEYLQAQIQEKTGFQIPIQKDSEVTAEYEIVLGNTQREVSTALNAETEGSQFAMMTSGKQIGLEGEGYLIAAAVYYFAQTFITGTEFNVTIPKEATLAEPITQAPTKYIFLIGDGMGPVHTQLYEAGRMKLSPTDGFSDGESRFYGYLFPAQGFAKTNSLSGTTDSAAGGTALSTGYKTTNRYIGLDANGQTLKSLTELANELGMATAVMSTEPATGATPSSFSAHCEDRSETDGITASQQEIINAGTILRCGYDVYTGEEIEARVETAITETLAELEKNPNGFFLMYEEAHIDKHSHNNDLLNTLAAVLRFNQAIGRFMEYACYHPDTFVLITADHETGGLSNPQNPTYSSDNHTQTNVPVFAYGQGSEVFNGITIENVQIPKTIAKMWGVTDFGDPYQPPAL